MNKIVIKNYDKPRLLPCGQSLCDYCISIIENPHEFICKFCKLIHQIPANGFPINEVLSQKLTNKFAKQSPKEAEELKSKLNDVETELKQIEFILANGDCVIKEHCCELRREVQLAKELKIERINEMFNVMIHKIDELEKESLNFYSKMNKNELNQTLNQMLNKMKQNLDEWNHRLADYEIEQEEICKTNYEIKKLSEEIKMNYETLKSQIFDCKMLHYRKNILCCKRNNCSEELGRLVTNSIEIIDLEKPTFRRRIIFPPLGNMYEQIRETDTPYPQNINCMRF